MKLIDELNKYLLSKLLQRIANNELTPQEIAEFESLGLDEHARRFIMVTNGNVKSFIEMYGDMRDDLKQLDKLAVDLECLAKYSAFISQS